MALYKKTLIVCSIIFLCCVVLSMVLLIPCLSQVEAVLFVRDYMVGVACSIIVVLVTTYLQFSFEQNKTLASVLSNIHFFFFDYLCIAMALDPNEQVPKKLWEYYYNGLEKRITETMTELVHMEWLSKKNEKVTMKMVKLFLVLKKEFSINGEKEKEELLERIAYMPGIKEIKDTSLLLAKSNDYAYIREEIIKDYEKAEKYLAKYDNRKK